jgi:hypothetical protein
MFADIGPLFDRVPIKLVPQGVASFLPFQSMSLLDGNYTAARPISSLPWLNVHSRTSYKLLKQPIPEAADCQKTNSTGLSGAVLFSE